MNFKYFSAVAIVIASLIAAALKVDIMMILIISCFGLVVIDEI